MSDNVALLKQKRAVLKSLTTKSFNNFDKCVDSKGGIESITFHLKKIQTRFEELRLCHISYMSSLAQADDENPVFKDEDMDYLDELEERLDIAKITHSPKNVMTTGTSGSMRKEVTNDNDHKKGQVEPSTIFKVAKINMRNFDGDMFEYLLWKEEVKQHYLPFMALDVRIIALKNILGDEVKRKVYGCSSLEEVWKELDRLYGNVSKISSTILNEISTFTVLHDDNDSDFIQLVDRIHRAQMELTSFQKDGDLDNDHMVAIIEQKLPPRIKAEWAELIVVEDIYGVPSSGKKATLESKFSKLLKFLKVKAAAKEYVAHDIRANNQPQGFSHHSMKMGNDHRAGQSMSYGSRTEEYHRARQSMPHGSRTEESQSTCIVHFRNPASHDTINCSVFASKSPFERRQVCIRAQACFVCFKRGHRSSRCSDSGRMMCYVPGCQDKKSHHGLLHIAATNQNFRTGGSAENNHHMYTQPSMEACTGGTPTSAFTITDQNNYAHPTQPSTNPFLNQENGHSNSAWTGQAQSMLPIQGVSAKNSGTLLLLSCMFDSGSTISIITENVAHKLKLPSIGSRTFELIKTGGDISVVKANIYRVALVDENNQTIHIDAYGMKAISHSFDKIREQEIEQKFGLPSNSLCRPQGHVDLLLGTDVAGIHPIPLNRENNLVLGRSPFGFVVWGNCMNLSKVYVNHISDSTLTDFFQIETLGVQCTPKCGTCKCGTCPIGGKQLTIREELELDMIKANLRFDVDHWTCSYPWIRDPSELPDNYGYVVAQLYTLERRLKRDPKLMSQYSGQIQDMLDRGVARICSKQELSSYKGPSFYLSHHEVIKESSETTPCRIVFNPAQNFRGHILNEYWALGANLVQSIFNSLLRFREYAVAIIGDISKMYHSVHTTETEWHTHRFLWRNLEERKPDVYIFLRNSFGDKPAGTIAICAIQKTCEKFGSDHPKGSDTLMNAIYVDDIVDSQPCLASAEQVVIDTETLLGKGGFKVKGWTLSQTSNSEHQDVRLMESDRVLGMRYDPNRDIFKFEMKLNFQSGKLRKTSEFNLTLADLPSMVPLKLTKRMLVSQVNGIYDPHGLIAPFVVRAKIQLREIWLYKVPSTENEIKLQWDDAIPDHFRETWIEWFSEAFALKLLEFPRCISDPVISEVSPMMIMFSDASEKALAAVCYLRYEIQPGAYKLFLVASKTKVAPLNIKSIVRYELQAAVMGKRLAASVKEGLRIPVSETIFIVDSEIVRAMINKDSYGFGTFYALRIGEIIESTRPEQWFWVEGKLNIADWATRGRKPEELGSESCWQKGPDFLYNERSRWPTRQSCSVSASNLPGLKSHSTIIVDQRIDIESIIDITRYSKLVRLIRVTARVCSVFSLSTDVQSLTKGRSLLNMLVQPSLDLYTNAKSMWVLEAQHHSTEIVASIHQRMKLGQLDRMVPYADDKGIVRARGRASSTDIGPIILPQRHPLSRLIVSEVHNRNHDGISTVVTKVRSLFWIIGAHRVAKSVRHKCVTCNKLYGNLQRQIMADLPEERTTPALPFQFTSLDLFGPYELKIPGKTTRGRNFMDEKLGYGVIYTDLSSRAVYVDLVRGYSMDAFLLTHRRFLAIRGSPDTFFSDQGPQLVAADKTLHKLTLEKWDKNVLISHGVKFGTRWRFSSPDSPWQNGVSESLIRGVKRSLTLLIGDHPKLTFEELQTALFEVANILNERPIGRHPTSPDECSYLRPNDLLLGRASPRIRSGPWEDPCGDLRQRFLLVQAMTDDWHKRWVRDYFHTLVPRLKWHTQSREVQVGDLVIVQDEKVVRGQWTMGQIARIHPSADGRARNVDVRYKTFPPSEPTAEYKGRKDSIIQRSVQRLVVIAPVEEQSTEELPRS